jgi:hypothetical protein
MATLMNQQKGTVGCIEEWTAQWEEESLPGVRSITEEIPRRKWDAFFATFTYRYQYWPVTIEQVGPDMGYRMLAGNRPLISIAARPSDPGSTILIGLATATPAGASGCFAVSAATHVWLKRNENGVDEALEIETADGTVTLLHLCEGGNHDYVFPISGLPRPN